MRKRKKKEAHAFLVKKETVIDVASPNTIKMNESIPKSVPIMVAEGNPNKIKHMKRALKRYTRGNSWGKRNGKNRIDQEVSYCSECGCRRVPPKE